MPVYNTEKYLGIAIDSVLSQTFKDFELICVNDGSTDDSQNILERYSILDSRIKIVNQANSGCASKARNRALDLTKGIYIYIVLIAMTI